MVRRPLAIFLASVLVSSALALSGASLKPSFARSFNLQALPLSKPLQGACGGAFVLQGSLMACEFSPYGRSYYA